MAAPNPNIPHAAHGHHRSQEHKRRLRGSGPARPAKGKGQEQAATSRHAARGRTQNRKGRDGQDPAVSHHLRACAHAPPVTPVQPAAANRNIPGSGVCRRLDAYLRPRKSCEVQDMLPSSSIQLLLHHNKSALTSTRY